MAREYPVDVNLLQKGYHFTVSELEKIIGFSRDTAIFVKERCFFLEFLQRKLWMVGKKWTLCVRKGEVCILTDVEASAYGERQARLTVRKHKRVYREMGAVDRSSLSNQRRAEHDRELRMQGLDILALKTARRPQPQQQPVVNRVTPPGTARQQPPPQPPLPMAWWSKGG
jgi:hypothetical protein